MCTLFFSTLAARLLIRPIDTPPTKSSQPRGITVEPYETHINLDFNLLLVYLFPVTDKAEGNKFAKDFEDSSLKLQEFVGFLDKELKTGPPLLDALGNADIFYEMQYKEVKIVANVSFGSNSIITFPA